MLELNGRSNAWQRGVVLPRGASINASYTRNLDENRGGTDVDFRSKTVVHGVLPMIKRFRFSFRNVLQGGLPFSPRVFGDITGDGRGLFIDKNKRAFIFDRAVIRADPNATAYERQLATDMEFILNNSNNIARRMLNENKGNIAPRNEVYQPLFSQLDARVSYTFNNKIWKALCKNSVEILAEVFNFGNLLNPERGALRIIPGGNQVLLQTLGIDQEALARGTVQYAYRVHRNFGQTALSGAVAP